MIIISNNIAIEDKYISFDLIRSAGPGGQNVNKVATCVRLRFDINGLYGQRDSFVKRFIKQNANKINSNGEYIIYSQTFRTQERNKKEALVKFIAALEKASVEPKVRIPTKVSYTNKLKRVETKKKHGEIKKLRSKRIDF